MRKPMQALDVILEELDTEELYMADFEDSLGDVVDKLTQSIASTKPEIKTAVEAVIKSLQEMANPEHDVKDTLMQLSDILRKCAIDASTSQ